LFGFEKLHGCLQVSLSLWLVKKLKNARQMYLQLCCDFFLLRDFLLIIF